ncbi:efflux RND transporter periplasmic adaptor subunit [Billgrantia endophytica]|uniref:GAF domain protein n=1 Tax=Billgrantia endophytica TaxID=2033802 RepID=A0A2N7TX16_9GAMM|nr:HlyD family efflux transporter periplasmic adaptor subunit [Halomonas endophytica]PMR72716.1 GAF domain protein [Halomonas endophytica]
MQLADNSSLAIQAWQENTHGAQAWLTRHCERAPTPEGVRVGEGVVLWQHERQWLPVALWPAQAKGSALLTLADDVRRAGRGMVTQLDEQHIGLGYPVRDVSHDDAGCNDRSTSGDAQREAGGLLGAVALRVVLPADKPSSQGVLQPALMALMARLEDGVAVLERDALQRHHRRIQRAQHELAGHLELLAAVLAERQFVSAGMQLVTRLAVSLDAERVTLGWRRGTSTRVVQVSHSAQFNRKMNRIRATEAAMDEAIDQRASVILPRPDNQQQAALGHGSVVSRAHADLLSMTGGAAVLTLPCLDEALPRGAITIEREQAIDHDEIIALESLMALCTRTLEEKRLNDRALPVKLFAAGGDQLAKVVGPGHLGVKLALILLAGGVAFGTLATGTDSVAADATLESREQRIMAAPFRGYIEEILVRPGDRVEAGQPLALMDARDLALERLQWQSELAKFAGQEQEMRAMGDRAALNVIAAQRDQAEARLALVESRLARATLLAPFDGVLVSGDLTQRLGGSVEAGEELYRISPLEGLRVELEVPEARINDIAVGQRGELVLAAMTEARLPLQIERLTPQTRSAEGSSRFVVEASLDEAALGERIQVLRPGMQGVGRIEIGERRRLEIWTRELVDWLRLSAWRWWG